MPSFIPETTPGDFSVENHGSVMLIQPLCWEVEEWLNDHTDGTWIGGALACDFRYVEPLVQAMQAEGFQRQGDDCPGHPDGPVMGQTSYCDGSCHPF